MLRRGAAIVCLALLHCVLAEARWHDLRNLRRHRTAEPSMDESPRAFDDPAADEDARHGRYRQSETSENEESTEDNEEADTRRAPTRAELDGESERDEQAQARRAPRHRALHPRKRHRRHHARHHRKPTLADLDAAVYLEYEDGLDLPRDKRHQRRRNWTEEDWRAFESSRRPELYDHDIHVFELEVREAQNSSLCNYTIIPIPDPGGRVPRLLEHVKCNYVGNRCRERGSYCCVQTYRNVEVTYPGNKNDTIKVYSGCVCALQIYGTLKPYNPKLPLDD
ncbi:uncharacterized protein LOC131670433 [Phymastichus coffea]|uniref:uncharacterized protein LOC131670433 n=1 Tax=Phymastichus coffea TaxID=108790 RepID=UPI00273B3AA3|nr:uncharacterized protein LOC131670433 [Phymastichus coffea]